MKVRQNRVRRMHAAFVSVFAIAFLGGCSSYVTPGRGADLSVFGVDDDGIARALATRPAAHFPVTLAVVRVQESGYASYSCFGYGEGAYSVITQRDLETEDDLRTLAALPDVSNVVTVNKLLVPRRLTDGRDLRAAAAKVHAEMVLIYTIDTTFETTDGMRPLTVLTLGLFPTKDVRVNTTAAALLLDTRTGYIYGAAEASTDRSQLANAWTDTDAAEQVRRRTERAAFEKLLLSFGRAWDRVLAQYGRPRAS
jgi:hypothetical protein